MFTDYLGNPINVGDIIAYPQAAGSSSADMYLARVEAIDPIVPDPRRPGSYCYESMARKADHAYARVPQRPERDPITGKVDYVEDWEKAYQVKVKKLREGRREYGSWSHENVDRLFTIKNVDRLVNVTDLTVIR